MPVTKLRQRQAKRNSLEMRVQTEAGRILKERGIILEGHDLDRQRLGRSNFVVLKSAVDRHIAAGVNRKTGQRHNFERPELDQIDRIFPEIVKQAVAEVFSVRD